MANESSEESQTGRLYGIQRTLSRLGETLNNFWYSPSEYEVAKEGIDRVYQSEIEKSGRVMREKARGGLNEKDFREEYNKYLRSNRAGNIAYRSGPKKGQIKEALTPEQRKEIREHLEIEQNYRTLKGLRSDHYRQRVNIESRARSGEIPTKRRTKLTYAMSALDSAAHIAQYIGRILPVIMTLKNEYVDMRQQKQIQDLYRRAEGLPGSDEVSEMPYEQLERTMKDVEQLKVQMTQILPVLQQILQRMDEEKSKEQSTSEEPIQKEQPLEKVAAVASISALTIGLLTLTRGRTIFTIKVSQNKESITLVLLLILVISLFILNKIQRKKK